MDFTILGETCGVSKCSNKAIYKCPQCSITYCSVGCYRRHSNKCIQDFNARIKNQLKGLNTSDLEREQFGALLRRLKDDDDGYFFQTDESIGFSTHMESKETDVVKDKEVVIKEHVGSGKESTEDAASLLTRLMNDLDDTGKGALFTILQKSMALEQINSLSQNSMKNRRSQLRASKNVPRQKHPNVISGESDEEDVNNILEKLTKDFETMDLSYEEILSRLPPALRTDFENRLREGRVDDLVYEWAPWWAPTLNDVGSDIEDDTDTKTNNPPPLPTKTDLLVPVAAARARGSEVLIRSIVDVLASYCAVMRFTNGDWLGDTMESARKLWATSAVLSEDARHESVEAACASVIARANDHMARPVRDAANILAAASPAVVRALFDSANILREAALALPHGLYRKDVSRKVRKIHFLMAWAFAESSSIYLQTARCVLSFAEAYSGNCDDVFIAKQGVNMNSNQDAFETDLLS